MKATHRRTSKGWCFGACFEESATIHPCWTGSRGGWGPGKLVVEQMEDLSCALMGG